MAASLIQENIATFATATENPEAVIAEFGVILSAAVFQTEVYVLEF